MAGKNGVSLLCYFLLLLSSINAQVSITTQPMNVTVCLSQSTTATFTCVVNGGSTPITTAGWQILVGDFYIPVTTRTSRHMLDLRNLSTNIATIVNETLTVTDVSLGDNGAKYRCRPVDNVISDVVTLTVIAAPPAITAIEVNEICANDFAVSWTPASSEEGLSYSVTLLQSDITGGVFLDSTMDTSYNFTGLTPNTAYMISVASVLNSCSGASNTIINTTVTVEAGVPNRVSILKPERKRNGITVMWDPADSPYCGSVLYYTVTIVNSVNANDINIMNTQPSERRAEFSNLINGTSYNISVAAVNRAGIGPTSTINVTTLTDEEADNPDDNDGDSGLSGGAIAGITIAIIALVVVVVIIIALFLYRKSHYKNDNDEILKSKSPESSSPDESGNEAAKKKAKPKPKQANKTEYAELQLSSAGTAPSVDPTKVDYTEVKEHEPLSYAQVQHEPGSGNRPVQGAPQVEYKEVWHQ